MSKSDITTDELISTLQKTNSPTIISEGKGDVIVLRRIEDIFADDGVSVIAAGGRKKVLDAFDRRSELPNNQLFLFFVDKDCWVYSQTPNIYVNDDLMTTDGYSIENDMFRDGELISLLRAEERTAFIAELERFLSWYSVAIHRHLGDTSNPISTSPTHILDNVGDISNYLCIAAGEQYPGPSYEVLREEYPRLMRGKSLIAILLRQLSERNREPKYSASSLLELGAVRSGQHFSTIASWVEQKLASWRPCT